MSWWTLRRRQERLWRLSVESMGIVWIRCGCRMVIIVFKILYKQIIFWNTNSKRANKGTFKRRQTYETRLRKSSKLVRFKITKSHGTFHPFIILSYPLLPYYTNRCFNYSTVSRNIIAEDNELWQAVYLSNT